MLRKDLDTLTALKDEELALLSAVTTTDLEAMVRQGNAADARVEAAQLEAAMCNAKNADLESVLGGTEAGQKLLRQKQRNELGKQIAAAQAEKDAAEKALGDIPAD